MKRKPAVHWLLYTGAERIACGKRQVIGAPKIRTTDDKHKATCNTCRRIAELPPASHPDTGPQSSYAQLVDMRLSYAGAIGLLCTLSSHLRPDLEHDDNIDSIELAVADFCKLTGWSYTKSDYPQIQIFPPKGVSNDGKQEETQDS